jgi:hypothetical protein
MPESAAGASPMGGSPHTNLGYKMSEIQSLAAPKASFDRRSVVKTAAWSVPVIAAAIAAPAAAASTPTTTLSAALIAGTGVPVVGGTPQMSGTGLQGFAVSTTGAAVPGAISVVIDVQPDAAANAAGVGLAVTARALAVNGPSSPYNFTYSRTGTGNVVSNVVLNYTVTVTVTVVESPSKSTVLPAMAFPVTLKPKTTLRLNESGIRVATGKKSNVTGPLGFTLTTSGTAVVGNISPTVSVAPGPAAVAKKVTLDVTASAPTRTGNTATFEFLFSRGGELNGALGNDDQLTFTVSLTVSGAGMATVQQDFVVTMSK